MEYEIIIKKRTPYNEKETVYEADDGKRYRSKYSLPEGAKHVTREYETGEVKHTESEIYSQRTETLDLNAVIKAINNI